MLRGAELDGQDLDADECRALERHAEASAAAADDRARDLFSYELEIHTAGDVKRVAFDEMNTPADLAGLVDRLRERARPVKP